MFVRMDYNEQKLAINDLDYFGTNDWVMADRDQMDSLFFQISAENTFAYELFNKSGVKVDFEGDSNDEWLGRFDHQLEFQAGNNTYTYMGEHTSVRLELCTMAYNSDRLLPLMRLQP